MPVIKRKTDEERAEDAARKDQKRREAQERKEQQQREAEERKKQDEERKRAQTIEKARARFFRTPAGRARAAFDRGDHLFQYSYDVMNQEAIIVAMVGSRTSKKTSDPTDVLNSVCREGWELVNGSFVFVEQGQQSRDKFMSSGQNVAIKGAVVGYYLFRRSEAARQTPLPTPWLEVVEESDVADIDELAEVPAEGELTGVPEQPSLLAAPAETAQSVSRRLPFPPPQAEPDSEST